MFIRRLIGLLALLSCGVSADAQVQSWKYDFDGHTDAATLKRWDWTLFPLPNGRYRIELDAGIKAHGDRPLSCGGRCFVRSQVLIPSMRCGLGDSIAYPW